MRRKRDEGGGNQSGSLTKLDGLPYSDPVELAGAEPTEVEASSGTSRFAKPRS